MTYSDFLFNEINVRTHSDFNLTNYELKKTGGYIHKYVNNFEKLEINNVVTSLFFYNESGNKLAHLLSIPNGYAQLLAPKRYEYESHIPYPPDFYINILDAVIKDEDLTNMKGFLKHYAYKKGADAATGATDVILEFKDGANDMTLATAKTNTDMIYVKKEFRKLRRKWESDIVESLRVGYTKYKLMRYSSLKKSKPEKDEEGNEIGGMIRTREFQNFGQTLLTPDEIWADFVKLMTDQSLYNNFEQNIKIKRSGTTYGPITKYTSLSEFKNDEDKPYFYKIFIGDDTEDDTEDSTKDNTINSIHFYSGNNFLGHRFKLLNVRYLWKYGRRASENNSAGVGNSWKNQLDEWRKMMGYPSGHGVNDIRMNQVGNIMLEFLKYNKDLIRDDDCVQEELISNYQKAVANSYWNKYDEVDNEFQKKGIHHSPIFWMIFIIVFHRVFNVFFSLIKKDDTGTSGFVYKLEGIPGFFSGLKDIFKYGDEGQITIHSPYSVLSPYWSLFRNNERMRLWFIKGYTEENQIWESDPKDGPYIPHSNKEDIHNSGQPDQSIYLPYDNVDERNNHITELKLINYISCVTIGFWFSFLENTVFEKLIRKKIFKDVGNSSKEQGLLSKIFIALVVSILVPILSLVFTLVFGGIITVTGLLWFFIIFIVGWSIVKLYMVVYNKFNTTRPGRLGRLDKIGLFASIIGLGVGLALFILGIQQNIFWILISLVILYASLAILMALYKSSLNSPESRIYKKIETLLSSPILEDYLIKNTQDKGVIKKVFYIILGGLAMGGGLIFALIKMVPLTLYLFLWGSGPMKGGPGSDNVSQLIDIVGILTMSAVFGLLVWITVRVYNKSIEGKIKVRENAIISAMPHMGYKIPRFKYDALFIGYKSKMSQEDYKKKIQSQIEYIEQDKGEFEMNDGTRRKWSFLTGIYNNKSKNKSEWDTYSNDYYYLKAKLDELKNKEKVKIGCLDEDNFEKNYPPLGVLGMTMFVFAAQMAMTQINSELPKELPEGLKNLKDEGLDKLIKKTKMAAKVKARIILMILITICVVFIWVIEYLPQLLMVMQNMDSREEEALKKIREWNNKNKDKTGFISCPVNLDEYENKCDNELVGQVNDILNKDKLVVPKVKWDVIRVIIGVVAVLLGLLFVYLFKN